jgi:hypothetical protein
MHHGASFPCFVLGRGGDGIAPIHRGLLLVVRVTDALRRISIWVQVKFLSDHKIQPAHVTAGNAHSLVLAANKEVGLGTLLFDAGHGCPRGIGPGLWVFAFYSG